MTKNPENYVKIHPANSYINISVSIIIFVFSLIIFRKYVFQGYAFMSQGMLSDLLRAYLPVYIHYFDSLSNGGQLWSWNMGIGTSMFAHADVYFDPFTYITFLGGRENIANLMIWSFIIKLISEGLAFSYYARCFDLNKYAVIITSVLYAFCGYSMILGSNLALGTIMVYFPLVFLGVEKRLQGLGNKFLISTLFLVCIYSYYFFYITGILVAGYVIIRSLKLKKPLFYEIINLTVCGIVSFCLSAFAVLPQVYLTLSSARVSETKDTVFGVSLFVPDVKYIMTSFARLIGLNVLGNGVTTGYFGYNAMRAADYFQNECFVTSLSVPLIIQYIYIEKYRTKEILTNIIIIIIMIAFPIFSYAFNAFATINYRWMFIVHLLVCLICACAIDDIITRRKVNIKILVISQLIMFGLLMSFVIYIDFCRAATHIFALNMIFKNLPYFGIVLLTNILMILISVLYNKYNLRKEVLQLIYVLIIITIFSDIFVNYNIWYGSYESVCHFDNNSKYGYDDMSSFLIGRIMNNDKSFYRIYKDFDSVYAGSVPSENDAMVQRYYGLKSYCSLNNVSYINFLKKVGIYLTVPEAAVEYKKRNVNPDVISGNDLNYIDGIYDKYDLLKYFGVKYYICKNNSKILLPTFLEYCYEENGMIVYKNNESYPLAFINNNYLEYNSFLKLSYDNRISALLNYTILNTLDGNVHVNKNYLPISEKNINTNECKLIKFSPDKLEFTVNAGRPWQYVSFSIPYDKGWEIYVDGKKEKSSKINISLLGVKLPYGKHDVKLCYVPQGLYLGIGISCITFIGLGMYWYKKRRLAILKR